ncbi:putative transferase [Medicago truncatula]|uniref:HXXXD-type acyl-transferase family protein n=1 Tax=Medicago truncatula TaxID=3880 RepID=G7K3A2_MEDTR|nr:coniferyl alcohol acyltransferase [Medicago truncatula]AET00327.1 HXXXD-type acyl-transferase family protein [Medicago truncatula]RHN57645.1 putative transferase [Medicago truncatula]
MCIGKGEFTVKVTNKEIVAAALPMQEHWLPLSNLDLILPPVDVGVFFCYKNPIITTATHHSIVGCLKNSLTEALVSYYAFAGEVMTNSMGEPELLCNNRGVDFVEAFADVELQSLNLYNPDETVEGKLVPKKKHGVLAVQATWMKCGGLVVACTFDHRIADAYSANMFLVSWAEIARPNDNKSLIPTTQPCFRRSLLTPRRPPSIHPSIYDMYVPISDLPPPPEPESDIKTDPIISRIYYVTSKELNNMQSLANSNNNGGSSKRSKLESFSAFLWKMVAEAASINNENIVAKMGLVVDGRKRLSNGDKNKEELMNSYFGNVLSIPYGGRLAEELVDNPLCWVADRVHEFLEAAVTEEHFLGLIDWVEEHRPVPGLARIYCGSTGGEEGPTFVVSSGQRFPESKVDFGWGKPVFGSYHFPWGGSAGYVMPMPSPKRNGDWLLYMHLPKGHLHFMEAQAPHFFRPISWDYLIN